MRARPTAKAPGLRARLLSSISIRLRLALWYGALLTVTLTLFSLIALAVLQFQLQSSLDANLQSDAQLVARTLQNELAATAAAASPTPNPSATATAKPSPTPGATATASPSGTPGASATATATAAPTPVPTPDPAQSNRIQHQLLLNSAAHQLLQQFDLTFEVIDKKGTIEYYTLNISPPNGTGLPVDASALRAALATGACRPYTHAEGATLLRILIYPVVFPAADDVQQPHPASSTCPNVTGGQIVGAVAIARPVDDMARTLDTLRQILLVGAIVAVIFASLGGWLIAGSGLRPIAVVTRTAKDIAIDAEEATGLGRRVGYRGPRDEVGALAETFDQMLAALERVAKAQRRFVADASHELRAPLTTIKGSLELLRRARDLDPNERAAAIEDAYAEAERMSGLVNDLLLLARVDAAGASGRHAALLDDQMRGRRELVELDQMAMDIFRHGRAQLQARRKDGKLQLSVGTLEPAATMADPSQVRQVLLILLDNAIKYTPGNGRIRISMAVQGGRAGVSVADTGMGIEPEILPHIFERFFRGDQARERDEQGSGLGLAIAQWIATSHGGEITVHSEPGKGSMFTLWLPVARRPGEPGSAKRPVATRRRSSPAIMAGVVARLASGVSRPRLGHNTARGSREPPRSTGAAPRARGNTAPPRRTPTDGGDGSDSARRQGKGWHDGRR